MNKLLDLSQLPSPRGQRQWHNPADMHVRSVDVHIEFELRSHGFDVLEALLEVGACATDPDLDFVLDESGREFTEGADDAFEG